MKVFNNELYDNPNVVDYNGENLKLECIMWTNDWGKLHRPYGKPAQITFFESGEVYIEIFALNGQYYREGGRPNEIIYFKNGQTEEELWRNGSGLLDYPDGRGRLPAKIVYDSTGKKIREEYWKNGNYIDSVRFK